MKRSKKKPEHYVNNAEFLEAMKGYRKAVNKAKREKQTKPPVTEKNSQIRKLAEIMEEYSETIRQRLNDRGANIAKMWGYIVKQSHNPYNVRNAANTLG